MTPVRGRLTYANVVATLALFLALGGTSYALTVTGRDVRDDSLTGRDVRTGSLRSSDVRDGSLLAADFGAGQLPRGEKGEKGDPGDRGPAGATNVVVRREAQYHSDCPSGCGGVVEIGSFAHCPPGQRATGGGVTPPGPEGDAAITESAPRRHADGTPYGWTGSVRYTVPEGSGAVYHPIVWAVCASP